MRRWKELSDEERSRVPSLLHLGANAAYPFPASQSAGCSGRNIVLRPKRAQQPTNQAPPPLAITKQNSESNGPQTQH
jgi:hypothetical protein